jgi:hypothetical protein
MEANGREEAFLVRSSVSPVRLFRIMARNCERNFNGNSIGTRHPTITSTDERGTMIMFVRMKYVGNLLKSAIVRDNVPACATIVTAADCQILSVMKFLNSNF